MLKDNLITLRKLNSFSQEEIAEKIGISRQAYSKWEKGETVPDVEKCALLANVYGVTVDGLLRGEKVDENKTFPPAPVGKHIFGSVTISERGQIVIPKEARSIFNIKSGDKLIVLGDENQGLALVKEEDFINTVNDIMKQVTKKNDKVW